MKLFRIKSKSTTKGEQEEQPPPIGPSTTFSIQSTISADATTDDTSMTLLHSSSSPTSYNNNNNSNDNNNSDNFSTATNSTTTATTTTTTTTTKKRNRFKKFLRPKDKVDNTAEARKRVAALLEPPPFEESQESRLRELKMAKMKAEERAEERGEDRHGSKSSSVVDRVVVGNNNNNNNNNSNSSGASSVVSTHSYSTVNTLSLDEEQRMCVRKDATIFIVAFLLHATLLPLRDYFPIPLLLIALQSISLWGLLNSVLVYAFDCIDFGQLELVKNMDYAKRLFVEEVRKYSLPISASVSAIAIGISVGREMFRWSTRATCHSLGQYLRRNFKFCDCEETIPAAGWGMRAAFHISSFIALRLGVFVLSLLFLGHMMLPKAHAKSNTGSTKITNAGKGDDNHRTSGTNRKSVSSFLLAAMTASVGIVIATFPVGVDAAGPSPISSQTTSQTAIRSILVAGSLNADTFLPIHRFPSPGENLTLLPNRHPLVDVPGGKGCNQAIACAKLSSNNNENGSTNKMTIGKVAFLGQFGNDSASIILQNALVDNNVDITACGHSKLYPSGRGYVMIVPDTGEVSAVVSGGSNLYGWGSWGVENNNSAADDASTVDEQVLTEERVQAIVSPHALLLLQCEVPHLVNVRLARAARNLDIPVIVDVGGEDRTMERDLLECCDYLVPNETELDRLAKSYHDDVVGDDQDGMTEQMKDIQAQIGPSLDLPSILKSVATLQRNGASNVLVTLGSRGSILVKKKLAFVSRPSILYQPSCSLPSGSSVVDETGAGDCYRAGFAVALLELCGSSINGSNGDDANDEALQRCMEFASAAGALAVTRQGAVPSIPSRREVEELLSAEVTGKSANDATSAGEEGASLGTLKAVPRGGSGDVADDNFPFVFGSRINSMKDRLDLVDPSSLPVSTPRDYLLRQSTIRGLGCVDFNYPQHFGEEHWTPEEAKEALDEVNLVAGAVCLRYPSKFARGAMNHPEEDMRREAIEITKQAAEAARVLGCNEVVVWSAYDGYDYPFQVNYQEKWDQIVSAFQECCDAYPNIRWSLEFKPTDENTRFFTVPSTGAAMLLVKEIDRPNMGLTLDMGHMLMAGENPGQSIAMVGDKLFGIQLNDGYTRLAAEDGMMFGSIHPSMALEAMYQLRQIDFKGHLYFDTFPQRTDPVKEAEYNIRRVKEFWRAAGEILDGKEAERIAREHDAIGALELVDDVLRRR